MILHFLQNNLKSYILVDWKFIERNLVHGSFIWFGYTEKKCKNFLVIIAKQERYYNVEPDIEAQMSSNENNST